MPPASACPPAAIIAPTASGKSALAMQIADTLNAEIISVDAGAVYRGMIIGSAAPTAEMQAQVPHHLVNIITPSDTYNVARFYHDAMAAVTHIQQRGKTPLLVGGSMMYFNALINGLTIAPAIPPELAAQVRREAAARGTAAMYRQLQKTDPEIAARLAPADTQRIIRACCLSRSNASTSPHRQQKHPPLPLTLLLLIPAERGILRQRIKQRLQQMWHAGLLDETKRLLSCRQLPADAPPLKMAGYRQAAEHLRGDYDAETMQRKAYYATCQLAKRQLTWLQKWRDCATVLEPFGAAADLTKAAVRAFR